MAMGNQELEDEFGRGVSILDYSDNIVMRRVIQTQKTAAPVRPAAILMKEPNVPES